jgi:hypothetical protein
MTHSTVIYIVTYTVGTPSNQRRGDDDCSAFLPYRNRTNQSIIPLCSRRPSASKQGTDAAGMGSGVRALMRRKQVDSERTRAAGSAHQLRKELSVTQLVAIG